MPTRRKHLAARLAPLLRRRECGRDIGYPAIWVPIDTHRIERGHRILEHHRDAPPAKIAQSSRDIHGEDVGAVELDLSAVTIAFGGSSPMVASDSVDLPEPLSPTMPTMLPRGTSKLTLAQRVHRPARRAKSTLKLRMLRMLSLPSARFALSWDRACRAVTRRGR